MLKSLYRQFSAWMKYRPPYALSATGWDLFDKEYRKVAPIRYFISRTLPEFTTYPCRRTYRRFANWMRQRTVERNHILKTGLEPGYYDLSTQMLHVSFNLLKDYVEIDIANRSGVDYVSTWREKYIPFYRDIYPQRRPEAAMAHLEWETTLDDPTLPPHERAVEQAATARETIALYNWWVNVRPARRRIKPREYDNQGLGDFMACFNLKFNKNAKDYLNYLKDREAQKRLDRKWIIEDDKMLIRLIKIRRDLWT